MALIPATPGDFRRREYWDTVFGSKNSDSLEWYGNYDDFAQVFENCLRRASDASLQTNESKANCAHSRQPSVETTGHIQTETAATEVANEEEIDEQDLLGQTKTTIDNAPINNARPNSSRSDGPQRRPVSRILHVGCGNSELSERLMTNGYGTVVNVDFSSVVIEQMKRKYRHEPNLLWECLDVRGGSLVRRFGEEAFDAIVDKGFFDALVSRDVKVEQSRGTETESDFAAGNTMESVKRMEGDDVEGSEGLSRGAQQHDAAEGAPTEQEETCKDQKENNEASPEQVDYKNEAKEYLLSALKVLKTGGVFIIISLAQDYVVKEIVRAFYAVQVELKIYPLPLTISRKVAATVGLKGQSLLPFIFCVEKKPGPTPMRENSSSGGQREDDSKEKETAASPVATRCVMKPELGRAASDDVFVIWALPKKIQAVIKWRLLQLALCVPNPGSRSIVSIHSCGIQSIESRADDFPRYVVTVYDVVDTRGSKKENTYIRTTAAILASPGEERCWLFATSEGNEELARQAGARRILVVTRGSEIPNDGGGPVEGICELFAESDADVQCVSKELGPYLADLALPDSGEIPLMMVRSASTRVIAEVARERSEYAGWITIRDVEFSDDDETFEISHPRGASKRKQSSGTKSKRRSHYPKALKQKKSRLKVLRRQMLFYCNPHTVQSEVKLTRSPRRDGQGEACESTSFAFLQPVCGYHIPIAAAFALLREARENKSDFGREEDEAHRPRISAAILGLGGGVLSMFLHSLFGDALDLELTCVDNDRVVVDLAHKYFGFRDFPRRLRSVLDDAHAYVKRLAPKSLHAIIIDINSGSSEVAMRCPPEDFVHKTMLTKMKDVLVPGGLLIFNLLCRCLKTKNEVIERLSDIFPSVSSIPVSEDANEVVVCQVDGPLVELPARRGVVDRHLRKLVYALEGSASTFASDRRDITKCAVQLLKCGKEWRVQACRHGTASVEIKDLFSNQRHVQFSQ